MDRVKTISAATLVCLTSACSTMNEDQCRSADWRTVGFEDGARGSSQSRIGDYRKACAEFGVQPDLNAYREGHDQGVRTYCTRASGFEKGEAGFTYAGVCPEDLEPEFLAGYNAGKSLNEASAKILELESQIESIERDIDSLEEGVSAAETEMVADGVGAARRSALLSAIKADQKRIGELEAARAEAMKAQGEAEAALDELRAAFKD